MVHLVFHVSSLRKFIGDENTIVPLLNVTIVENLSYEEVPVEILDREVKRLRTKEIASDKLPRGTNMLKAPHGKPKKI